LRNFAPLYFKLSFDAETKRRLVLLLLSAAAAAAVKVYICRAQINGDSNALF
jgi:hypothetical protein